MLVCVGLKSTGFTAGTPPAGELRSHTAVVPLPSARETSICKSGNESPSLLYDDGPTG